LRGSTVKKYLEELEIAGLVQVLGGPPYSVRVTEEGMKVLEKKGT
jgi:predicted transcriptional regulator